MNLNNEIAVNDLFEVTIKKLSKIKYLNFHIKNETKKLLDDNNKYIKKYAEYGRKNQPLSSNNFSIHSPYSGKLEYYGRQILTLEDKHKIIENDFHKRRLWLIVDMHEILEEYVRAICGIFGIVKKRKTSSLRTIKDKFPSIREIEIKNRHPIGLIIYIVQELRHCIVHNQGIVKNRDKFVNDILKNTENKNNDNYRSNIEKFIKENGEIITRKILSENTINGYVSSEIMDYFENEFFYSICQEIIIINTEVLKSAKQIKKI
jgi:hypothetical protein